MSKETIYCMPPLNPDDLQKIIDAMREVKVEASAEIEARAKVLQQFVTFSVDDVAKLNDIDPSTVRRFIKKNILKTSRLGGAIRITQEALQDFYNNKPISHGK